MTLFALRYAVVEMENTPIKYVSDENGTPVSVIVPIDLWREIESERETAYLLQSDAMRQHLMAGMESRETISEADAFAKLGIHADRV